MKINNSLDNIKNFALFYGTGEEDKLMSFDLLILEPKGHKNEDILLLKNAGKRVIAYLSVVEISKTDEDFEILNEDDIIKINGDVAENKEYGTLLMDISSPHVQSLLLSKTEKLLEGGYDGVFIDTIGNIEYLSVRNECMEKMLKSASSIMKKIKFSFPNSIIIQNNGFNFVCDYTARYLNAICFENPPYKSFGSLIWTYSAFKRLDELKRKYNLQILILQETEKSKSVIFWLIKKIAKFKGYLYYKTHKYYNRVG